jgi:rhamnulokinase
LEPTFHYRDARSERGVQLALRKISREEIFAETGIQFMPINTLFQLASEAPERMRSAARILGVADGFNHMLGGDPFIEESMASTFQLYNPIQREWSRRLIEALGLPPALFPRVVPSGSRLGKLSAALAAASGLPQIEIVATCSHDTGTAVAAVPAQVTVAGEPAGKWAYVSSGTWSLMGVECDSPILNESCRKLNFTNEIGFGGSIRLLKNIVGLWIVQECRREWAQAGDHYDYDTLTQLASEAAPFTSLINAADARFVEPGGMIEKIASFCRETGQPEPRTPGAIIRCVLESLALLYHRTVKQLEQLTGHRIERLHIVGGGSRNRLLNQLTCDALGISVLAGPVEATAAGNLLIQAIVSGQLKSLSEARESVRASFEPVRYEPDLDADWSSAMARFASWA